VKSVAADFPLDDASPLCTNPFARAPANLFSMTIYLKSKTREEAPFTEEALLEQIRYGGLDPGQLARREGSTEWVALRMLLEPTDSALPTAAPTTRDAIARKDKPLSDPGFEPGPPPIPGSRLDLRSNDLVPVIRRVPALGSALGDVVDDVIGIYNDHIVVFSCKRKEAIPGAAFEPDGSEALNGMRSFGRKLVFLAEQVHVKCSTGRICGNWLKGSREQGRELSLVGPDGTYTRLFLPEQDARMVRRLLAALLRERFTDDVEEGLLESQPRSKPLPERSTILRFGAGALIAFALGNILLFFAAPTATSNYFAFGASLLAVSALTLVFYVPLYVVGLLSSPDAFKRRRRMAKLAVESKVRKRKSARVLRSRVGGWLLKCFGILNGYLLHPAWNSLFALFPSLLVVAVTPEAIGLGSWIIMAYALSLGNRLCLKSAGRALAEDLRKPIVFLRPFFIDGQTSLNPDHGLAQWLGVASFRWLKRLGPVADANPLRLLRLFVSNSMEHTEEQMAAFFRRYGPFVAIGEPGERFSHGGAARFYVDDSKWQDSILELLRRAQFVVLHPSLTDGVRWETEQTAKLVPPDRILLCLQWFQDDQARYDEFRAGFVEQTGLVLPRCIGSSSFAVFDASGKGRFLPLRYRSPLLWPIAGCVIDFQMSFADWCAGESPDFGVRQNRIRFLVEAAIAAVVWSAVFILVQMILFWFRV
jgi:hypothetical protein